MMANRKKGIFAVIILILLLLNSAVVFAPNGNEAEELAKAGAASFGKAVKMWFNSVKEGGTGIRIYDQNKILIDFIIFFVIFLSISTISLSRALGAGGKTNAVLGLSLALSVALALAAIKAGMSITFFIPFVKNAMFFIMFLVIFLLFRWLGLTSIFWNIIVSVILTYLLFNAGNIILDKDRQLNLGNIMGIPTLQESLSQTKYELTTTSAEFNALQSSLIKSGYYADDNRNGRIDYEEILKAKSEKQRELDKAKEDQAKAEAEDDEAKVEELEKKIEVLEAIINIIEGHQRDYEDYGSAIRQGVGQVNDLAKSGHATKAMLIPTAPVLDLVYENKVLICKIVEPSTLSGVPIPTGQHISYEARWFRNDQQVDYVSPKTYDQVKDGFKKPADPEQEETWHCVVKVTFLEYPNEATSNPIVIGKDVKVQRQIDAIIRDSASRIEAAKGLIEQARQSEAQNKNAEAAQAAARAAAQLRQTDSNIFRAKQTPGASDQQKTQIDSQGSQIISLSREAGEILSRVSRKTPEGEEEQGRIEKTAEEQVLTGGRLYREAREHAARKEYADAAEKATRAAETLKQASDKVKPEERAKVEGLIRDAEDLAKVAKEAAEKEAEKAGVSVAPPEETAEQLFSRAGSLYLEARTHATKGEYKQAAEKAAQAAEIAKKALEKAEKPEDKTAIEKLIKDAEDFAKVAKEAAEKAGPKIEIKTVSVPTEKRPTAPNTKTSDYQKYLDLLKPVWAEANE